MSEASKQLTYKYGLIFLYYYIQQGLSSKIFDAYDFDSDYIKYDASTKKIELCDVYYDEIIELHNVDKSKVTSICVDAEGESINYQGLKECIKAAVLYFKLSKKSDLDETNTIKIANDSYIKFSVRSEEFKKNFGEIFKSYFDLKNKKVLSPFIDFYESLF